MYGGAGRNGRFCKGVVFHKGVYRQVAFPFRLAENKTTYLHLLFEVLRANELM